jgi:predicted amidohydrolase
MSQVRVGLVQLRTPDDQAAALAHATPWVRQAAAQGAQFIVTPEVSNIVQRDRAKLMPKLTGAEDDVFVQGMVALATELKVWLLIGSALVLRQGGGAANRSLLIGPHGRIVASYDKMHMFDVDLPSGEKARESEAYVPGEAAVVAETPWGRVGLSICYDVRFAYLYRALAKADAVMLTVPAAFTRSTGEAHWETLLRARAIETGSYVLAAAQGGKHEDGRGTWGHSMIVGPWGDVVASVDHDEPAVVAATLDLDAVAHTRQAIPALANERAFAGPFIAS